MSQLLTKVEGLLKDKYLPAIATQINLEPSPFLEKIRKVPLTNNTIRFALTRGLNGGFGFGAEGSATPKSGEQRYVTMSVDAVDMYVDIAVSNKTVELASSNAASMINVLDQEIKSSYAAAKWNVGRALFGDGSGVLCRVLNEPPLVSATFNSVISVDDATKLAEGLVIDIYKGTVNAPVLLPANTGLRILTINYDTNELELDGVVEGIGEGGDSFCGFITVQNSFKREICGLGAIFNENVPSLYGMLKGDNKWLAPVTHACGEDGISDIDIYTGVKKAKDRKGSSIDLVMMGDEAFRAYQECMRANNIVVADKQRFVGGAVGYKVLAGNQEIVIVNEHFVPANEAWGVDTSAFSLHATPWNFMAKNGAIFIPTPGTSVYRALLASYGNLVCTNPGGCVKFTGCNPSFNG